MSKGTATGLRDSGALMIYGPSGTALSLALP